MKLALVVQRYGATVGGGSEAHCRAIAERLHSRHDVTVLTTCATDHLTWYNDQPAGEQRVHGVRVLRFPCRERNRAEFDEVNLNVLHGSVDREQERRWFEENGPVSPQLLSYLETNQSNFDAFLFWTFRYHTSFAGLPMVADRAILLPTAEDDPVIRMGLVEEFFRKPVGFFLLTVEERQLVQSVAGDRLPHHEVLGAGIDPPATLEAQRAEQLTRQLTGFGDDTPFVLYLGRVDPNKGCHQLFHHHMRLNRESDRRIPLVVAGRQAMKVPRDPSIVPVGFVSDVEREALLARTTALVMPSPYESLSLVLLEAWNREVPALVNGRCDVLKGQVTRANGGLWYENYFQYREGVRLLLEEPLVAASLGRQGNLYVRSNYRWPKILAKLEGGILSWPSRTDPSAHPSASSPKLQPTQ